MNSFAPKSHKKSGKNICSGKHFCPWLNATNNRDRVKQTLKCFQFDPCPICMCGQSHIQTMQTNMFCDVYVQLFLEGKKGKRYERRDMKYQQYE